MKSKILQFLWWWGPAIVICVVIFILSATPNLKVSEGVSDFALRKTAHMGVYALLFLAVYRALIKDSFAHWNIYTAIWAGLIAFGYGITDELHQHFVPTRSGLLTDLVFDAAGICIALTGLAWWGWWNRILSETNSETARLQDGQITSGDSE